jgi:methionine aminopeptidase
MHRTARHFEVMCRSPYQRSAIWPDQCPCTRRFQIVPQFCGHGVGAIFHASPMIMHNRNNEPDKMQLWQTFTIEPILCTGSPRHRVWPDKWTVSVPEFVQSFLQLLVL